MKLFSKNTFHLLIAVTISTTLSAQIDNKKPVANEGSMDKAVEAIDSAKSTMDSVRGSREGTTSGDENKGGSESGGSGTVVDMSQSAIYVNSRTAFEITSTDSETKVDYIEYKINDGSYQKYSNPIYLPQEGVHTITYRAVDHAGNKEAARVLTVTVDNTPPDTAVTPVQKIHVAEDTKLASTSSTFSVTATDSVSGVDKVYYSIDGGEKQEYTGPIKFEKSGSHTVKVTATDKAGNESDEFSYVVNVDNQPPTVKIIESMPFLVVDGKNYAKKGTTFSVKATDPEAGVNKILVKLDGQGDFVAYADAISFTTSGEHTIEAKAIDNVGNESAVETLKVLVDVIPPTTTIKAINGSGNSSTESGSEGSGN
ncbi:MAG: chitobiase/beta-hexosaminidase C-terminal domain-containing protein [Spirochaetota bacterium]